MPYTTIRLSRTGQETEEEIAEFELCAFRLSVILSNKGLLLRNQVRMIFSLRFPYLMF
jgi:hypothetical protein